MKQINKFCKDLLLFLPLTYIFTPLTRLFLFLSYFNKLIGWIWRNKKKIEYNDFYSPIRDYSKRYELYEFVCNKISSNTQRIVYLEFGVAEGASFNWWMKHNFNEGSRFYGFDTFEGLPEKWGTFYEKGDMRFEMPAPYDNRGKFYKGLFQDTLHNAIQENMERMANPGAQRIILMDADLYSATIFTLSQLYPYLRKGDLILFDEFSVAMHEFKAYTEFVNNFYVKLKPVAAVNNFYQVAFEVE